MTNHPNRSKKVVVVDRREVGRTEMDARGNFLAPDQSAVIARIRQSDNTTRTVYAHTRALAREWREAVQQDQAMIDGIPSSAIALITEG